MHKLFWIFSTFLIVLTMLSALGGGIRFRENFMDELFDTINDLSTKSEMDVVSDDSLKATLGTEQVEDEQPMTGPEMGASITEEPTPSAPVGQMSDIAEDAKVIEAFDGEGYAAFD